MDQKEKENSRLVDENIMLKTYVAEAQQQVKTLIET